MGRTNLKKRTGLLLAAAMFCALLTGCTSGSTSSGTNTSGSTSSGSSAEDLVSEFASFFLPMDEDAAIYEESLDAVASYLDGTLSQEEALEIIADSEEELTARQEAFEEYAADEAAEALFDEYGINASEAENLANSRLTDIASFLSFMESISCHLQYADEFDFSREAVQVYDEVYSQYLDGLKGYYFYILNDFFAEWDADDAELIEDGILAKLQCYLPEGYAWETDTEVAENKIDLYLDEMSEAIAYAQEYYGDSYSNTLEIQDAYARMEELLERGQELETRISELSAAIEAAKESGESLDELWEEYDEIADESETIAAEWAALQEEYPWLDTAEE